MVRVTQARLQILMSDYGLNIKSVSVTSSITGTVASKKLIEVFDHSAVVNFMLRCNLLILTIIDFNLFFHKKHMSSM